MNAFKKSMVLWSNASAHLQLTVLLEIFGNYVIYMKLYFMIFAAISKNTLQEYVHWRLHYKIICISKYFCHEITAI